MYANRETFDSSNYSMTNCFRNRHIQQWRTIRSWIAISDAPEKANPGFDSLTTTLLVRILHIIQPIGAPFEMVVVAYFGKKSPFYSLYWKSIATFGLLIEHNGRN